MTIRNRAVAVTLIATGPCGLSCVAAGAASAKPVPIIRFANCTAMHRVYPHGVGRTGARDKVRGKTKPVTTFFVNTRLYNANTRMDADRDGIACEKR
jgi:hypothetical protein